MQSITTSAPGKLLLMGEHAVVFDHPCIVTAVNHRMKIRLFLTDDNQMTLNAPDVEVMNYQKSVSSLVSHDMPKGAQFVEIAVRNFFQTYHLKQGINITSTSDFSSQFGFGSSSAVTVATIKALSEIFDKSMSDRELFDLSYKTVLDIQGKGSGFDVAAAVYGGTLFFVTGGKRIEPISVQNIPLVVGYTGVKADTVKIIERVKKIADQYPIFVEGIYGLIEELVKEAKTCLEKNNFAEFGKLMIMNQGLLESLGVSTEKLSQMNSGAIKAGAYGAKLSGAGGGDCMIAVAPEEKRSEVSTAIEKSGGTIIDVQTNTNGIRVE